MSKDFQQDYVDEAKQVLKNLEQSLLTLEKRPGDQEEINNAYRHLHTLKGGAGMFGFTHVERLTHELEYVYSDIRDGVRQLDDFILDLTLHAVDVLGDLIDGKDLVKETDKIISDISNLKEGDQQEGGTSSQQAEKEKAFALSKLKKKKLLQLFSDLKPQSLNGE
jgi:two-component system, chemotaxis family, sensor kinase CheA